MIDAMESWVGDTRKLRGLEIDIGEGVCEIRVSKQDGKGGGVHARIRGGDTQKFFY